MHRSETDVLKTCMKREERFVKRVGKRAAMNAYRVNSSDSERCTLMITESHTACHKSNECKKAETKIEKSRVKVSNSLTELFHTLKSEGVIVQTALGPDGSFRIGQWILRSQFVKSYMVQYTHNHGAQKYLDDATDLAQPDVSISQVGQRVTQGQNKLSGTADHEYEGRWPWYMVWAWRIDINVFCLPFAIYYFHHFLSSILLCYVVCVSQVQVFEYTLN